MFIFIFVIKIKNAKRKFKNSFLNKTYCVGRTKAKFKNHHWYSL